MAMQCTTIVAQYTIRHWQLNWRRQRQKIWWRICVKKWEVATMSDILMTVSVCGWISWNNRANNWPASSLQHCACMNSTPGDWARRTEQALEQANAAAILTSSLELDSLVHFISHEIWSIFSSRGKFWSLMKWVELEALTRYALLIPMQWCLKIITHIMHMYWVDTPTPVWHDPKRRKTQSECGGSALMLKYWTLSTAQCTDSAQCTLIEYM